MRVNLQKISPVFKPSSYFNNNNIDIEKGFLWIRIYCPDSSGSDGGTDQGQLLKALIPLFSTQAATVSVRFCKSRELSNTVALFTKPSEAMQIQAAAAPAQPL